MLPNKDVWGEPESWQYCKYRTFTGTGNSEIKAIKPQIADFGSGDGSLYAGNLHGKTPINSMIDKTVCPCGQDPDVSVFGSIGLFYNYQNVDDNKIPNTVIIQDTPVNWFLYDGYHSFFYYVRDHIKDRQAANERWKPEMSMTDNINGCINPFLYYQIRSLMCQIVVACITDYQVTGVPNITWRTADDWKTNYSSQKIADIRLQIYGYGSNTTDDITYLEIIEGGTDTINGIAVMIETSDEYSENVIDYSIINSGRYSMPSLIGTNLVGNWYEGRCFYMCGYGMFDGQTYGSVARSGVTDGGWCVWTEIPYSADNYEKIMKMTACFGMMFTDKAKFTFPLDCNDVDLYIPIIDNEGIAHGEYTHGAENLNNDLLQLDSVRDKNYDPSQEHDRNTYSNITGFNSISGGASMTKRYVLDKANVDTLSDDLWTISSELAQVQGSQDYDHFEAKVIDNFLVTSPIDSIVSIKRFPFDVPHTFSNTKELVKLGKNTATAQGYATYNVFNTVQFRGVNISKRFGGCFLDYEPYTQYEVYVPFCGTTNLQAADIVGHTLNIRLQIDLLTGTCTAYIMADSLVIETLTGNCACDLQITGTDTTYMNSAIVNSITNARNAKTQKEVTDLSTISPAGLFSAVMNPWKASGEKTTAATNKYQADYNLTHLQTPLHSMGTASALTGWYQEFNARLMIYYPEGDAIISTVPPKLADLTSYAHTTGFATVDNKKLSNYTGLTVCSDVDLSGISQATATEKEMIYNALTGGIYI